MLEVVEIKGPALLLQARGRINSRTALAFETAAKRAFAGTDQDVIIDASQVTYLSTAGLRAFLRLWQQLRKENRSLHVCSLKPHIQHVFKIIGFDRFIPIEADSVAALAAVEDRTRGES